MSFLSKDKDLLLNASNLKQAYHKAKTKADWGVIQRDLNTLGYKVICDEAFRCRVKAFEKKNGILKAKLEYRTEEIENKLTDVEEKTIKLQMEKVKLRDEKSRFNKSIKEVARKEDFHSFIKEAVKELEFSKKLESPKNLNKAKTGKAGVLQLSDWHFGLTTNNFLNEYNIEVFSRRIQDIINKVYEYSKENDIEKLYILLQGDFMSGGIHDILRIQNQEDIISQVIHTSEILADIISTLSSALEIKIEVSTVLDNHSRVTQNKKDSLEKENYMRITEWFLKSRLSKDKNVTFLENERGADISNFEIYGFKCISVHGHKDKFNNIVPRLTSFTREVYDYMFTSHLHHFHSEEINMVMAISNGSLCGVDDFSGSLRASSHPMQMFSIFEDGYGLKQMYPIIVE